MFIEFSSIFFCFQRGNIFVLHLKSRLVLLSSPLHSNANFLLKSTDTVELNFFEKITDLVIQAVGQLELNLAFLEIFLPFQIRYWLGKVFRGFTHLQGRFFLVLSLFF